MRTPSHLLVTAVFGRHLVPQPVDKVAILLGAFLPDIPFALLTLFYEIQYRWLKLPLPTDSSIMEYLHFDLFFTDPVWIISHNFFHSLIINGLLLGLGYWGLLRGWRHAQPLLWLSGSMLFHTLIDIFTHHSDGPLLFFPLSFTYRFSSPISYWESAYYGRSFTVFEYILDIGIILYFIWTWRKTGKLFHSAPSGRSV